MNGDSEILVPCPFLFVPEIALELPVDPSRYRVLFGQEKWEACLAFPYLLGHIHHLLDTSALWMPTVTSFFVCWWVARHWVTEARAIPHARETRSLFVA